MERWWLIHFEDAARDVEVFNDEKAARRRSDYVGMAWTHTLFAEAAALDSAVEREKVLRAALELIVREVEPHPGIMWLATIARLALARADELT